MPRYYDDKPWVDIYPEWFAPIFPEKSESVLDKFRRSASMYPESSCIYYFDAEYSFAQVEKMALSLAAALADKGICKGDRVLFVLQNIPQTIIASLAVWMRGGIVVPVNPMCTSKDLKHLLTDSGAQLIICEDMLFEKTIRAAAGGRTVITTSPLDFLVAGDQVPEQLKNTSKETPAETFDLLALIGAFTDQTFDEISINPDDLAYLVYTSGTTGPPKGAMVSHANIDYNC